LAGYDPESNWAPFKVILKNKINIKIKIGGIIKK
jgi:hypothetical protein